MKGFYTLITVGALGAASATGLGIGYLSKGKEKLYESEGRIMSFEEVGTLDEGRWKDGYVADNVTNKDECTSQMGSWIKRENLDKEVCYKLSK